MRFIPNTLEDREKMFQKIGVSTVEELFSCIPEEFVLKEPPCIGEEMPEANVMEYLAGLSEQNVTFSDATSFIGEIAWHHYVPSIVRATMSLPSFYTAYTPYQPELSQGTLEAVYEFQSYMASITGMDASNASLYDGASAAAEAMIMLCVGKKKLKAAISSLLHPYVKEVLYTYAGPRKISIVEIRSSEGSLDEENLDENLDSDVGCVIVQSPNAFGIIEDMENIQRISQEKKVSTVAVVLEPTSLGILKPPGDYGFDVVCGEAQSFGMYPQFGGPGLGFICVTKKLIRKIPGRIVGRTEDIDGNDCFVMTLRAREQDIRRDKATSNICTNNALCALQATVYLSTIGEKGLRELAKRNINHANFAFNELNDVQGINIPYKKPFFNEFLVTFDKPIEEIQKALMDKNILISKNDFGRYYPFLKNACVLCFTEMVSKEDILNLKEALKEALQ
ncbi:MAG: aminomethyl-transferring glycine dehydrogenase subunit GcvPA [Caldisericia bacterium]|nr:aminomethyl-transferring glycine dehydrogenase subunit GcvPA [Caldisericia bacterium]